MKLTHNSINHNIFAKQVLHRESKLIESGPAPIKMGGSGNQWIFIYNAATTGGFDLPPETYTVNAMLIDYDNIKQGPVARLEHPILKPQLLNEVEGQVNKSCIL